MSRPARLALPLLLAALGCGQPAAGGSSAAATSGAGTTGASGSASAASTASSASTSTSSSGASTGGGASSGSTSSSSGSSSSASTSSSSTSSASSSSSSSSSSAASSSSSASTSSGGTTGSSGSTGTPDAGPVDPCVSQSQACPTSPISGYAEGDGLRAINRCAFPMSDQGTWASKEALVDQLDVDLPVVTVADVAADLNRAATQISASQLPGSVGSMQQGFAWASGDESVAYWIPQGVTGSGDADPSGRVAGRRLLLVSWYYDQAQDPGSTVEKGVRLALVDVTNPVAVAYRFLLLVEPVTVSGHVSFKSVNIHAGGIAWVGDLLYVADTSKGFRVFDLSRILRVDTSQDLIGYDAASGAYYAHSYKYAVPQVDRYLSGSTCTQLFSYVALDRTSSPPALVAGEYTTDIYGRVYRYDLDPATHRLAGSAIFPQEAYYLGQKQVQGGLSQSGRYLLSSSAPAGGGGALYKARPNVGSTTYGWVDAPEDLSADPSTGLLWCVSEAQNARYVFATHLSDYLP